MSVSRADLSDLLAKAMVAFAEAVALGDYVKAERFANIAFVLDGKPVDA